MEEKLKYYIVYIRQYSIIYNDTVVYKKHIKTTDIYHYIGYYYCTAIEKVERIDYQEINEETFNNGKDKTFHNGKEVE